MIHSKFDWRKFAYASLVTFGLMYFIEYLYAKIFLYDMLNRFAHIWRPNYADWMYIPYCFCLSLVFVFFYVKYFKSLGKNSGLILGLYSSLILDCLALNFYFALPLPPVVLLLWVVLLTLNLMLSGYVVSLIYKHR